MAAFEYLTQSGVIVPDTAEILEGVKQEYRAALGEDLDTSPETPQGVLIVAETESRDAVARNNADLANQINPDLAGGTFLDAIWALTGGQRVRATPTLVRAQVAGVPGAVIPAGARVSVGAGGSEFFAVSGAVLGVGPSDVTFQAVEAGPLDVPAGALNTILSPVLGWETVTNASPGERGRAEETDAASRRRRRQTLALQGVSLPEAIVSGLYTVEGVRSLTFRENVYNTPIEIEDVTLAPHSFYACVDGGSDQDVARMLLRKKSLGAGWNGDVAVAVVEPFSGQTYMVRFARPRLIPIYVRVTVAANGAAIPDIPAVVRRAILDYAEGAMPGEPGFGVGEDVSSFELAGAINRAAAPLYVRNITMSTSGVIFSPDEILILISEKASISEAQIAVTVT